MKTIKILNNSVYTIKFSVNYKNSPSLLNSNYISSTNSGSLSIPDNAENVQINVSLIDIFYQLQNATSVNLTKATDKYYEFIGSPNANISQNLSILVELINYTEISNNNFISLVNKTTVRIKALVHFGMYLRSGAFGVKEESAILKNNEYFSYPIPINDFISLTFTISISSKSSPKPSDFKTIKIITIKDASKKYCYEFSRKGFTTGLYDSKNCYKNSSNIIMPNS